MLENLVLSHLKNGLIKMNMINKNEFLNNHKWGGSGIEKCLFDYILDKDEVGSTIIELGAGYCSTKAFSEFYNLYSIEENPSYVNLVSGVNYILANIKDNWYDREIVKQNIPKTHNLVFVDGPSGEGNRSGLLDNLDLFNENTIYIFHDTYREPEMLLAKDVAKKLNKTITFFDTTKDMDNGDFWVVVE